MTWKRITVTEEDENGRNKRFRDNLTGTEMTAPAFVKQIENGDYPKFHVRVLGGIKTPVSNPDDSENNNLG